MTYITSKFITAFTLLVVFGVSTSAAAQGIDYEPPSANALSEYRLQRTDDTTSDEKTPRPNASSKKSSSPQEVAPPPTPEVPYNPRDPSEFNATAAGFLGVGLGMAGGIAGMALMLANSNCESRDYQIASCLPSIFALGPGMAIGSGFGAGLAVFAYGELSGFDGSYILATVGGIMGGFAGLVFLPLAIVGSSVGAVLGYMASMNGDDWEDDGTDPYFTPSASLVDFDAEHGLSLGVPAVGFQVDEQERRVSVPLLGGRF